MNKYRKIGFFLIAVGAVTPIALNYVSHQIQKLTARVEASEKFNAELNAKRKAHESVRVLIKSGRYDDLETADREQALKDDYSFYRMIADIED